METFDTKLVESLDVMRPQTKGEIVSVPRSVHLQDFSFSEEQISLIKRMHQAAGLTDDEFSAFIHFCRKKRVDPLLRQAYATKRKQKDGPSVVVIMISIEGLRAIADRTHEYCPGDEPIFIEDAKNNLIAAKVSAKKYVQGEWHEFKGVAYFREFDQNNFMWSKMPRNQLAKCAEAQALRKGWPEDCGGFYVPEEFPEIQVNEESKPTKEKGKLSKLKKSESENRGHGNEGIKETVNPEPSTNGVMEFTGNVSKAFFHQNKDKEYIDLTFDTEITGATHTISLYCWHKSLFRCLLQKPKNALLVIKGYGSHKGWPTVEDVKAINGVPYEKGEAKGSEPMKDETASSGGADATTSAPRQKNEQEERNNSLLELSNLFESIWPSSNKDVRPLRNRVGQAMFELERKEQLMDLAYPQMKIDAAVIALRKYYNTKDSDKPTTETGVENHIFNLFKQELEELKSREVDNF